MKKARRVGRCSIALCLAFVPLGTGVRSQAAIVGYSEGSFTGTLMPGTAVSFTFNVWPQHDGWNDWVDSHILFASDDWTITGINGAPGPTGCLLGVTQCMGNPVPYPEAYWGYAGPPPPDCTVYPMTIPGDTGCGVYFASAVFQGAPLRTFIANFAIDPSPPAVRCPGNARVGLPADPADPKSLVTWLNSDGYGFFPGDLQITWYLAPENCPEPQISLNTTVSGNPADCPGGYDSITVLTGTTVYYCYQVTNISPEYVEVTFHTLTDSVLGPLGPIPNTTLAPGASTTWQQSAVVSGPPCITNTGTWTATTTVGYGNPPGSPTGPFANRQYSDTASDGSTVCFAPTAAVVTGLAAYDVDGRTVIEWSTDGEIGTAGFQVLRLGPAQTLAPAHAGIVPAVQAAQGGTYRVVEQLPAAQGERSYVVHQLQHGGGHQLYGPFRVWPSRPEDPSSLDAVIASGSTAEAHKSLVAEARGGEASSPDTLGVLSGKVGAQSAKISVREDGLYRVAAADIAPLLNESEASIRERIADGSLRMTHGGQPISWLAVGDSGVLFYGEAIDSLYTSENVYRVEKGIGATMAPMSGGSPSPVEGLSFTDTLHFQKDQKAWTVGPVDPTREFWFWTLLQAGHPVYGRGSFTLEVPDPVLSGGNALLTLRVQGASDPGSSQQHHLQVSVNGQAVGDVFLTSYAAHESSLVFSDSLLNTGSNVVEVTALQDPGVTMSHVFIDGFDLTYERSYLARDGSLAFVGEQHPVVTVDGFASDSITVLDVSDPSSPKAVNDTTIAASGAGTYSVSLRPAVPDSRFLAVSPEAYATPSRIRANHPSRLRRTSNQADHVIITTEELAPQASRLADYRRRQRLRTMVVDVEDIFDEYNGSIASPFAIRDFLADAYGSWSNPPRYVLLAGDGSFDFRGSLGYGENLLPPMLLANGQGLYAADSLLADLVGGDGVPEIAVGRLPATTSQEFGSYVDKVIAYETDLPGLWPEKVLLAADDPDIGGDFTSLTDAVQALIPPGHAIARVDLATLPIDQARQALLDELNSGAALMNYIGHAGLTQLAQEGLLRQTDLPQISNFGRMPVVTAMTCHLGNYALPGYSSLGESLVIHEDGGAGALWSSAGPTYSGQNVMLDEAFFRAVFAGGSRRVGDAVLAAIEGLYRDSTLGDRRILELQVLFGDPALKLRFEGNFEGSDTALANRSIQGKADPNLPPPTVKSTLKGIVRIVPRSGDAAAPAAKSPVDRRQGAQVPASDSDPASVSKESHSR